MKLHARIALVSALAFTGTGCADQMSEPVDPSAPAAVQAPTDPVMPGEVLVKFRPGADAAAVLGGHGRARQERGYRDAFVIARGGGGMERGYDGLG